MVIGDDLAAFADGKAGASAVEPALLGIPLPGFCVRALATRVCGRGKSWSASSARPASLNAAISRSEILPSTGRPTSAWKAQIAARVLYPIIPSAGPGS